MRLKLSGGIDLPTGALIVGGALLIAAALVGAAVLLAPAPRADVAAVEALPTPGGRPSAALPADRVATVLALDAGTGASSVVRSGDHIDVLGYFSKQAAGDVGVTRVLAQDVPVLTVDRSGANVSLALSMSQDGALLLQEAQALGAHPFVALRPLQPAADQASPSSFSDADLADRLAGTR